MGRPKKLDFEIVKKRARELRSTLHINGRILIIVGNLLRALPSLQGRAFRNSPVGYFSEGARLQWWQRGWG
jgi:hypothetical protein